MVMFTITIDKPESKSQSKIQAQNPKESNLKREIGIWTKDGL